MEIDREKNVDAKDIDAKDVDVEEDIVSSIENYLKTNPKLTKSSWFAPKKYRGEINKKGELHGYGEYYDERGLTEKGFYENGKFLKGIVYFTTHRYFVGNKVGEIWTGRKYKLANGSNKPVKIAEGSFKRDYSFVFTTVFCLIKGECIFDNKIVNSGLFSGNDRLIHGQKWNAVVTETGYEKTSLLEEGSFSDSILINGTRYYNNGMKQTGVFNDGLLIEGTIEYNNVFITCRYKNGKYDGIVDIITYDPVSKKGVIEKFLYKDGELVCQVFDTK